MVNFRENEEIRPMHHLYTFGE